MGLYSGGLIIGRIFASEIWGAYFREGFFLGGRRGLGGRLLSEFYGMYMYPLPRSWIKRGSTCDSNSSLLIGNLLFLNTFVRVATGLSFPLLDRWNPEGGEGRGDSLYGSKGGGGGCRVF